MKWRHTSFMQKKMRNIHTNFSLKECGLYISTQHPFIGASPDGVVNCDCCGEGCIEIKCPYNERGNTIAEAVTNSNFCLQNINSEIKVDKKHPYYAQIQTQIHVCEKQYCDFIVWTEADLHIERILADDLLWPKLIQKASLIFHNSVLPEIIGKCFTRVSKCTINNQDGVYCYCK